MPKATRSMPTRTQECPPRTLRLYGRRCSRRRGRVHIRVHIDITTLKIYWRRRPDLNRGWRFCRFHGVVNRVVSCWSLVRPAPPFCLVLGPYWTTYGRQHSDVLRTVTHDSFRWLTTRLERF